jgi:hypothetical protein
MSELVHKSRFMHGLAVFMIPATSVLQKSGTHHVNTPYASHLTSHRLRPGSITTSTSLMMSAAMKGRTPR